MSSSQPNKRRRRGGPKGDSVEDYHKDRASREAQRNTERKQRDQQISKLLKDDKAISEEIEKLQQETDKDHSKTIKALEGTLARHEQDAQKRMSRLEQESELAVKRRLAAGLSVGPAPPPSDPPRRGPGFLPPKPPPLNERPVPLPPARPVEPLLSGSRAPPPPFRELPIPIQQEAKAPEQPSIPETAPQQPRKLFMPTAVAVNLHRKT